MTTLSPITHDAELDHTTIPLPGGWSVEYSQSEFGTAGVLIAPDGIRTYSVAAPLVRMAREIHAAVSAQQVPEEKQILRDGVAVFLKYAKQYMDVVAELFKMRRDGPSLAERSPTKDQDCFEAFVALDTAGKNLKACIEKLEKVQAAPKGQP